MIPLHAPSAIFLLLVTKLQYVLGNPAPELVRAPPPTPSTCGPTIATVGRVTTITIKSIVTLTHSCYTQTISTKRIAGASGCPTLTKCGPHPACIIVSTQIITIPPVDACCISTPTSLVPGACPTCVTGCDVSIVTEYITGTPIPMLTPTPTPNPTPPLPPTILPPTPNPNPNPILPNRAAHPDPHPHPEPELQATPTCYTTVINTDPIPTGATQTVYPVTTTKTSLLDCKGCGIVTKFLNGFGPASQFKATTTALGRTSTVVVYSCF